MNDPNNWCREHDDPRYVVDLIKRVTRVSVGTMAIVDAVPELPLDAPQEQGAVTARSEILRAIATIVADRLDGLFTPAEVVATLRDWVSPYAESTIRTHVVSLMCVNAPAHHAVRYPDIERVAEGLYRLVRPAGRA